MRHTIKKRDNVAKSRPGSNTDGGLPVRDGEECGGGTLLQVPEPQRCTG